jgi:predicted DNA-binding transcriptional regulator AlpA
VRCPEELRRARDPQAGFRQRCGQKRNDNIKRAKVTDPRLMTGPEVAAYLGIASATFAKWVANGRAPKPLPSTRRWDRKAIDLALDKISGIPSAPVSKEDRGEEELQEWIREDEARQAARELDPEANGAGSYSC